MNISNESRKSLAEAHLRQASDQLRKAGDPKAAERVTSVLRSVKPRPAKPPRHA